MPDISINVSDIFPTVQMAGWNPTPNHIMLLHLDRKPLAEAEKPIVERVTKAVIERWVKEVAEIIKFTAKDYNFAEVPGIGVPKDCYGRVTLEANHKAKNTAGELKDALEALQDDLLAAFSEKRVAEELHMAHRSKYVGAPARKLSTMRDWGEDFGPHVSIAGKFAEDNTTAMPKAVKEKARKTGMELVTARPEFVRSLRNSVFYRSAGGDDPIFYNNGVFQQAQFAPAVFQTPAVPAGTATATGVGAGGVAQTPAQTPAQIPTQTQGATGQQAPMETDDDSATIGPLHVVKTPAKKTGQDAGVAPAKTAGIPAKTSTAPAKAVIFSPPAPAKKVPGQVALDIKPGSGTIQMPLQAQGGAPKKSGGGILNALFGKDKKDAAKKEAEMDLSDSETPETESLKKDSKKKKKKKGKGGKFE